MILIVNFLSTLNKLIIITIIIIIIIMIVIIITIIIIKIIIIIIIMIMIMTSPGRQIGTSSDVSSGRPVMVK